VPRVGLRDGRADQVLVAHRGLKGLLLILDLAAQIELLLCILDGCPADAAAVDLLQIQSLGIVVSKAMAIRA